jgi:pilus assembly protein CpaB
MARMRITLVLLLAVAAGGGLAFGTYKYVNNVPAAAAPLAMAKVVVAANDLELGALVEADDVRVVDWPASAVPAGAFSSTDDVVGRGLVMPAIQNEPILPMKLASKELGAGLPVVIPEGKRAVSVRVNEVIGVAGYVLPGTRVDVIATASPTTNHEDTTSKLVLSNVQVLAAGTKIEQDEAQGKPMAVNVVTLLVTPEDTEALTLASTEGKIQLALRNPLDKSMPPTPGIRPAALLGAARPIVRSSASARSTAPRSTPVAVVAPPPPPTVEVIRGDKRAEEVVR